MIISVCFLIFIFLLFCLVHSQQSVLLLVFVVVLGFFTLSVIFTQQNCCCQFCCVTVKLTELWYFPFVTTCSLFRSSSSRTSGYHTWPCIWLLMKSGYYEGSWFSVRFVREGCHGDTESEKGSMVFHAAAVCMDRLPTAMAMRAELAGSQATCGKKIIYIYML